MSKITVSDLETHILLPREEKIAVSNELDAYGFRAILVAHYSRRATRKPLAAWLHSWKYWDLRRDIGIAIGNKRKQTPVLVPTAKLRTQLLKLHYEVVELAPSPWALATVCNFLPQPTRSFKILCVIPKRNTAEIHKDTYAYLDFISDNYLVHEPVVLLPASYRDNREFNRMLKRLGLRYVFGPAGDDKNGLTRMSQIFRHFEFVVSGHFGTHLPFAAINGCRVGIIGPYIEAIDSRNPWYPEYRDLISFCEMKKTYGYLFADTLEKVDFNKKFFEEQSGCGLINDYSVWARIAPLMGWTLGGLFSNYFSKMISIFSAR